MRRRSFKQLTACCEDVRSCEQGADDPHAAKAVRKYASGILLKGGAGIVAGSPAFVFLKSYCASLDAIETLSEFI